MLIGSTLELVTDGKRDGKETRRTQSRCRDLRDWDG